MVRYTYRDATGTVPNRVLAEDATHKRQGAVVCTVVLKNMLLVQIYRVSNGS